jgi:ribose transport system ATP-binding protein
MRVAAEFLLQMKDIHKSFPGVYALKGANLEVRPNEIIGLVGENGAGKSTMMKVLVGLYRHEQGQILLRGKEVAFRGPRDAAANGVGMVFQEQSLLSNLSVGENLFIVHEQKFKKNGFIQWKEIEKAADILLARLRLKISPHTRLSELSMANRQMVEIARLLWLGEQTEHQSIIILDEPTTVLSNEETETLFQIMNELKSRASIILISHRLDEIISGTDRIIVFRDGNDVARLKSAGSKPSDLHKLLVGRELATEYYRESEQRTPAAEVLLSIKDLGLEKSFRNVSFDLRRGEIISLIGTIGSGKEDIVESIIGVKKPTTGTMAFKGAAFNPKSPMDSVHCGIGYVPENRRDEGLILYFDICANVSLPKLNLVTKNGLLNRKKERELACDWIKKLKIRTSSENAICVNLSGGNQQKVVLAKWLAANVDLLILNHPTRGIDVGAKEEVYVLIRELAKENIGMILLCDTLEEDIGLANRLLILKDGRLVKEMDSARGNKPTPLELIEYIV